MTTIVRSFCLSTAALAAALAAAAAQAETLKLTLTAGPPPTVTPTKVTKEFFIPEINKRLAASGKDFKIEWTEAYSQSLAKFTETLEAVENGIAHVGVVLKNFEESKLPLEQYAAMIPFGTSDTALMGKIDGRVRQRVPEMDATFAKYNQVALAHAPSVSMQMFTKFPLDKVADLKGRKIGGSGALAQVLRGTGAVIVTSSMANSYTDIRNGVYDGYPIAPVLAWPYKTYQAAPYMTQTDFGSTMVAAITVNKNTWDAMPPFVQKIFRDVGVEWTAQYRASEAARTKAATEMLKKEGVKFSALSDEERQRWAQAMPNVAQEWAETLEKQGQPGKKVLAAYMEELRAAGAKPARAWDKE